MVPNDDSKRPQPTRRVFDISHPRYTRPTQTSRPLIVGHHPQAPDPMVNQRPAEPKHLKIAGEPKPAEPPAVQPEVQEAMPPVVEPRWEVHPENMPLKPEPTISDETAIAELAEPETEAVSVHGQPVAHHPESVHGHHQAPEPVADDQTAKTEHPEHHDAFSFNWWMVGIFIIVAIFVTLYLLVDAGVIRGASHLPFHIFQQNQ